ncbi:MAG: DUF58 domain-containing protein [Candidatus Dormibacteria bacterium]
MATTRDASRADSSSVAELIERHLGLTLSGVGLGGFAVLAWVVARAFGGKALYLLAYAAAAVLGTAIVIARRRRPVVAVRSKLPLRAREGQSIGVTLQLESPRRLGAFVIEEQIDADLGPRMRLPVPSLSPTAPVVHEYAIRPRRRGVFSIGPLEAEWSDPFGVARSRQELAPPVEIIVHPSTEPVIDRPLARRFEDPPLRPPHSRPWPSGFEFYGMRDYVPGDDLRRVVWRATARTGRVLVREFEQGVTDRIVIVLDTDRAWHRPGPVSDTFEQAVRTAASIGARHIKEGFTVSLVANGRDLATGLRGPSSRIPFLDELARVEREKAPLGDAVQRLLRRRGSGSHFVVVTPHLSAETAGAVRLLLESGGSVLVAAIIWEESDALTVRRAVEIGAQVVEVRTGGALAGVFAHALGAGVR